MLNLCILGLIKKDGFIIVYHGTRYLVLFEKKMVSFTVGLDIKVKGNITYVISQNYAKIKVHL